MSSSIGIQQHMNRCKEHSAHNLFHSATKKNDQYRHSLILQVVQEQSTALPFLLVHVFLPDHPRWSALSFITTLKTPYWSLIHIKLT